jgi:hypothetical protein
MRRSSLAVLAAGLVAAVAVAVAPRSGASDTAPECTPIGTYADADIIACPHTGSTLPDTVPLPTTTEAPPSTTPPPSSPAPSSSSTTTSALPATTTTTTTSTVSSTTTTSTPAPPTGAFFDNFATPTALDRFDWQLHTGSQGPGPSGLVPISATFQGEHDLNCNGPSTYRTIIGGISGRTYIDVSNAPIVWYCAPGGDPATGHVMTGLDTPGIATLSFSPKQSFTNVKRVCWDQNMNDLGAGKWMNVFVVPAADVATNAGNLNYKAGTAQDLSGNDQLVPAGSFNFTWLRGSTMAFQGYTQTMDFWKSTIPQGMDVSPAPRYQVCLTSGGNMVIKRPDGTTDTRALGAVFPPGEVRVIWQDASYNPTKHAGSEQHLTWHWDNVLVETS